MPVIAVGQINDPDYAETILQDGQADMIALARPVMYDPRWVWHAAHQLGAPITYPRQYERGNPDRWGASGINAPGNLIPEKSSSAANLYIGSNCGNDPLCPGWASR